MENKMQNLFVLRDPGDYELLRKAMENAGYNEQGLKKTLGFKEVAEVRKLDLPKCLYKTQSQSDLNTLIKLFFLVVPVDLERVENLFVNLNLESLITAGLLIREGENIVSKIKIRPFRNFYFAHDIPDLSGNPDPDIVLGIASSNTTLSNLVIRRPVRRTLDLGCGCGVLGLLSSSHSEQVHGVDTNPRAISFSRFNAYLNGVKNIEFRLGNLFEPVSEEKYDLILSNPPYVISPDQSFTFRDGGLVGDQFCRELAQEAPRYLEEGGFFQMLCNWTTSRGQDWKDAIGSWFADVNCDVRVGRSQIMDPSNYASMWIESTETKDLESYNKVFDKWVSYYEGQSMDQFHFGWITMRRRSAKKNWFHAEDAPERMLGPCGEDIVYGFAAFDFMEMAQDSNVLLDSPLFIVPTVRMNQQYRPANGRWTTESAELRRIQGMAYTANVDSHVAGLVSRCDGSRTLRELIKQLAESTNKEVNEVTGPVIELVRNLVLRGFLFPNTDEFKSPN